jgi:nitrous oxide reductase
MNESKVKLSRRQAVTAAGAVGALAAAAVAVPLARREAEAPIAAAAPEGKTGYQVTQHVLRYYETTRI